MRIQNVYCLMLIAGSVAIGGCTSTSTTQKTVAQNPNAYSGKWPTNDPASVEIISEEPLTVSYCFRSECELLKPTGTVENMTYVFPLNSRRKGASINFARNEMTYIATYSEKGGGRTWKTTLTKPAQTLAPAKPVLTPASAESALKPAQQAKPEALKTSE